VGGRRGPFCFSGEIEIKEEGDLPKKKEKLIWPLGGERGGGRGGKAEPRRGLQGGKGEGEFTDRGGKKEKKKFDTVPMLLSPSGGEKKKEDEGVEKEKGKGASSTRRRGKSVLFLTKKTWVRLWRKKKSKNFCPSEVTGGEGKTNKGKRRREKHFFSGEFGGENSTKQRLVFGVARSLTGGRSGKGEGGGKTALSGSRDRSKGKDPKMRNDGEGRRGF